eukprot:362002_1
MAQSVCILFILVLLICNISCLNAPSSSPIDDRVSELLSKMSLDEKAMQIQSSHNAKGTTEIGTLQYDAISDKECSNKTGSEGIICRINIRNEMQKSQQNISPLNIPCTFRSETLHSSASLGTIFPTPIVLGATYNTSLITMIGNTIAYECNIFGIDMGYAPVLQVVTDPRFGRFTESYSSDSIFVSRMGYFMSVALNGGTNFTQYVPKYKINNQAKHFMGYACGGRSGASCNINERTLREIYLRPWEAFVASGGKSIMCAHNAVNGMPMHANNRLLTQVMRNEFNWTQGLVGSDNHDVANLVAITNGNPWTTSTGFHIASDLNQAVIKSMNAGLDIVLGTNTTQQVISLVKNGRLNVSVLNRAVSNLLHTKFAAGLFEQPMVNSSKQEIDSIDNATFRRLALEAALQGIVLLKNDNNTLPFNLKNVKHLAVIGPVSDFEEAYYGSYANIGADIVTILDALKNRNISYEYNIGCSILNVTIDPKTLNDSIKIAKKSDHIILMVGDNTLKPNGTTGEFSNRVDLELSGGQLQLIWEIIINAKVDTKIVVVLLNGRPVTFGTGLYNMFGVNLGINDVYLNPNQTRDNGLLNIIPSLLTAYNPGEEGGNALIDIIFGDFSPSGRLTTSWPQSAAHIHTMHGTHSPYLKEYMGENKGNNGYLYNTVYPLFPMGFGLGYAEIIHSKINNENIKEIVKNCKWRISLSVTNKSPTYDSYEIVQIYYTKWVSNVVRYELSLAGFAKVFVTKGKTVNVNVDIYADSLTYYDQYNQEWVLEDGTYYFYDGKNAQEYNYWSTLQFNISKQIINPCKFWHALNE